MTIRERLVTLGAVRDGLFVVVSVVYIIGYVTWAGYSWQAGLGSISVFDDHYFVAGTLVTLIMLLAISLIVGVERLAARLLRHAADRESIIGARLIKGVALAAFVGYGLVFVYQGQRNGRITRSDLAVMLTLAVISYVASAVSGILTYPHVLIPRLMSRIGLVAVGLICVCGFIVYGYPSIPAGLGGGAPRVALLELRATELSRETFASLCPGQPPAMSGQIVRSRPLWVYSSSGNLLISTRQPPAKASSREILEIRREAVFTIHWVND